MNVSRFQLNAGERGAVLLEVVLALVLFVAAATVITAGFKASVDGVDRLRRQAHALNLAVTVFSEIEMGLRASDAAEPAAFDPPFEEWTWSIETFVTGDFLFEGDAVHPVEVVIRHAASGAVLRLSRDLPLAAAGPMPEPAEGAWNQ